MEASADHWFSQVGEDLETAKTLLGARRYRYAVFFCHLALEKFLKGCVAGVTGTLPPRSHDLVRLAELAGLVLPLEHGVFFEALTRDALEARYPVRRMRFTRSLAEESLTKTERALEWLRQKLPQQKK